MAERKFTCPILGTIMADPVVAADGHTYERAGIEEWFARHMPNTTVLSPLSGHPLPNRTLLPNHALRSAIDDYISTHPELEAERQASSKPALVSSHVDLHNQKAGSVEPWEFDKQELQQKHKTLIITASRASLTKGTGELRVWAQSKNAQSFESVSSVTLSPVNKYAGEVSVSCMESLGPKSFVCGARDGSMQVWSVSDTGVLSKVGSTITAHRNEVTSVAMLASGFSLLPGVGEEIPATIVSGSRDCTVKLWRHNPSQKAWQEHAVLQGHSAEVRCVTAVKEHGHIVSGGNDWSVLAWDASNPDYPIQRYSGHSRPVRCVASNGVLFASGSEDEKVLVWDSRSPDKIAALETGSTVLTAQWGASFLAAGGGTPLDSFSGPTEQAGGWVRVWDVRTWSVLGDAAKDVPNPGLKRFSSRAAGDADLMRQAHTVACLSLRFVTLNGHPCLVSGGDDKRIRIWGSNPRMDAVPFYPRPKLLFDFGGEPQIPISVDSIVVVSL